MLRHLSFVLALALASVVHGIDPVSAQQERAMLMEGKQTLYQRVITRVGASLTEEPGAAGTEPELPAFSVFYVYERRDGWLRVGQGYDTGSVGWIKADKAIDWKQTIVVAFNDRELYRRDRVLLFRERDDIEETLCCDEWDRRVAALRTEAESGRISADSPLVSIEPELHVDIDQNFYILPILSAEEVRLPPFGVNGRYLEVASVVQSEPEQVDPDMEFRVGVTFVVDTTISMDPYIDGARRVIERVRDAIARSNLADRTRFGLVGFRQDPEVSPGVEYHVRTFLPLDESATAGRFGEAIGQMRAASVSTRGFKEDSVGGIVSAVDGTDWSPFQFRVMFLITDAGPKSPDQPGALSAMLPAEVRAHLSERNVFPVVVHLKSPAGRPDHASAEAAYRAIADHETGIYLAIENADADAFEREIDALAAQIVEWSQSGLDEVLPEVAMSDQSALSQMHRAWRAMQLSYLAARDGQQAPDILRAWISDRALENPGIEAVEVRVMLTRNQLATLRDVARAIVEEAEEGLARLDSTDFFDSLRSAVLTLSVEPARLARTEFETLGEAMGEYLEDLPYQSEIVRISERDWVARTPLQQRQLLGSLVSKIEFYNRVYETNDRWVALHPGAPAGEWVTTIPLRQLP